MGEFSHIIVPDGAKLSIGRATYVGRYVELGAGKNLCVGSHVTIQDRCIILGDVIIGNNSILAPNVYISSGGHCYDYIPQVPIRIQDELVQEDKELSGLHSKPVLIGEDCWIGINSVLMQGITLGKGCVVGAGSVVTKSFPPYSVVAGVPARIIKKRLEFNPPSQIIASNVDDLPYFYTGFSFGGYGVSSGNIPSWIEANDAFRISLDFESGKTLVLKMKLCEFEEGFYIKMVEGDEVFPITKGEKEYVFDISNVSASTVGFIIEGNKGSREVRVLIHSAYIE